MASQKDCGGKDEEIFEGADAVLLGMRNSFRTQAQRSWPYFHMTFIIEATVAGSPVPLRLSVGLYLFLPSEDPGPETKACSQRMRAVCAGQERGNRAVVLHGSPSLGCTPAKTPDSVKHRQTETRSHTSTPTQVIREGQPAQPALRSRMVESIKTDQ